MALPYGADMRLFINHGNTPTVMYGPGDVKVAHAADEFVALAEVAECAEVLAQWILRRRPPVLIMNDRPYAAVAWLGFVAAS